jgi:hypothetical protein
MTISLTCPQCSKRHQVSDSLAGRKARCGCGASLVVPALAPAPAVAVSGGLAPAPSVFDELSSADRDRLHREIAPALPPAEIPRATAVAGLSASEYLAKARGEIASRQQAEAEALPWAPTLVVFGLGVPGGLSLLLACILLFALGTDLGEVIGTVLVAALCAMQFVMGATSVTAAALIYFRVPYSRPLGYLASVLNLCGSPVHSLCACMTLFFLSTSETAEYIRQGGPPGRIHW